MSNQLEKNEKENMPYGLLISATYNSQKNAAVLKFYDLTSQRIFLWADKSGTSHTVIPNYHPMRYQLKFLNGMTLLR